MSHNSVSMFVTDINDVEHKAHIEFNFTPGYEPTINMDMQDGGEPGCPDEYDITSIQDVNSGEEIDVTNDELERIVIYLENYRMNFDE